MKMSPLNSRSSHWAVLIMFSLAGFVLAGSVGCDNTELQTLVLGGLQDLAVTMVDAFFLVIQPEEESPAPTPLSLLMDTANTLLC